MAPTMKYVNKAAGTLLSRDNAITGHLLYEVTLLLTQETCCRYQYTYNIINTIPIAPTMLPDPPLPLPPVGGLSGSVGAVEPTHPPPHAHFVVRSKVYNHRENEISIM